ncbi:hypothetical protein C0992_005557 [Termitomyces sp. T32_za158]|nr:hypothetical protein C0992_005557 [Termitomyces sp. T32_za158]
MNESLISPFNLTHPTAAQSSLFASAAFARFDPSGRYLGVGRSNGTAAVWDLETRARIRSLEGHVKAVTSLDWSFNSRWILTSSKDWNVIKWDLASQCDPIQRMVTIRFDGPVLSASFHPRNSNIVLALLSSGETYVEDLRRKSRSRVELREIQQQKLDMIFPKWHPLKSLIVSTTKEGNVLLWHSPNPERWGAFAGGFEEVDENVEYEEREDEFDIEDEEEIMKRKMKAEDEEVDIDTIVEDTTRCNIVLDGIDAEDEDAAWAAYDRDDVGEFRMKIIMQEDIDE